MKVNFEPIKHIRFLLSPKSVIQRNEIHGIATRKLGTNLAYQPLVLGMLVIGLEILFSFENGDLAVLKPPVPMCLVFSNHQFLEN